MHINHDNVLRFAQGLDQKIHVVLSRAFSRKNLSQFKLNFTIQLLQYFKCKGNEKKNKQAGAVLGQAQLKLGLYFTSINLH